VYIRCIVLGDGISGIDLTFACGLPDVVAPEDLKGLTADDLQLLLSGRAEAVTVEQLR